jgi:hypothetical protein
MLRARQSADEAVCGQHETVQAGRARGTRCSVSDVYPQLGRIGHAFGRVPGMQVVGRQRLQPQQARHQRMNSSLVRLLSPRTGGCSETWGADLIKAQARNNLNGTGAACSPCMHYLAARQSEQKVSHIVCNKVSQRAATATAACSCMRQ